MLSLFSSAFRWLVYGYNVVEAGWTSLALSECCWEYIVSDAFIDKPVPEVYGATVCFTIFGYILASKSENSVYLVDFLNKRCITLSVHIIVCKKCSIMRYSYFMYINFVLNLSSNNHFFLICSIFQCYEMRIIDFPVRKYVLLDILIVRHLPSRFVTHKFEIMTIKRAAHLREREREGRLNQNVSCVSIT